MRTYREGKTALGWRVVGWYAPMTIETETAWIYVGPFARQTGLNIYNKTVYAVARNAGMGLPRWIASPKAWREIVAQEDSAPSGE